MLYIIIGIILGAIYGFKEDGIFGAFFDGFFGFMIGFFAWLIVGMVGLFLPYNEVVTKQPIYALNDSSEIEGRKFLFSGYIDEDLVYRYVVDSEKGKHIKNCDNDNAYIKDIESDNPYVEYHNYEFKYAWFGLFAMDYKSLENYQIFYVPSGTITNEYNVDMK